MMSRFLAYFGAALLVIRTGPLNAQTPVPSTDTLRLSLEEAVSLGLRVADEVRQANAQAEIAGAQLDVARAVMVPQLRINSTYSHVFENARSNAVSSVFNQPNTYTVTGTVSQPLFQGGRLFANARAAGANAEASRLSAAEQRAAFTVTLQRAYLNALLADKLADIQDENLQLSSARLTQVKQFQSAGRAAQYDVLRAKVEKANIEPLAIQARNDRDLAQLELKRLLNLPLDRPLALTTTIDPQAAQTLVASFEDSTALPNRLSLRAAELNAKSRRLGVAAARADFLPSITAFFNTGFQAFPPPGFGFPTMRGGSSLASCPVTTPPSTRPCQNGGWFEDRNMGVQFSWPILDGFRLKSAIELAKAQNAIAELELRQTREVVAVEVARARAELHRARAVFDARRETQSEAKEAFSLASLRFSRGLSTQLEVSDAQLALLTAESGEARATYDLYLATAELARALGRPIPMPPTTRVPARRSDN